MNEMDNRGVEVADSQVGTLDEINVVTEETTGKVTSIESELEVVEQKTFVDDKEFIEDVNNKVIEFEKKLDIIDDILINLREQATSQDTESGDNVKDLSTKELRSEAVVIVLKQIEAILNEVVLYGDAGEIYSPDISDHNEGSNAYFSLIYSKKRAEKLKKKIDVFINPDKIVALDFDNVEEFIVEIDIVRDDLDVDWALQYDKYQHFLNISDYENWNDEKKKTESQSLLIEFDKILAKIKSYDKVAEKFKDNEIAHRSFIELQKIEIDVQKTKLSIAEFLDPKVSLSPESEEEFNEMINDWAGDDPLKQEQVARVDKLMNSLEIGFDAFIELNKGSDLGTFISFLFDPVGTRGKDGQPLNFAGVEIDDPDIEQVDEGTFKEKFKSPNKAILALVASASKINPDWAAAKESDLRDLYNNRDKKLLKELILSLYREVTRSDKPEESKKKFKFYFTTILIGDGNPQTMGENAFNYFERQMDNEGEKLDELWAI